MKTVCASVLYLTAGVVSGAPGASPVLSAVSDTARFSWEIPQGGLGTGSSFFALSPAGVAVFIVTGSGTFLPTTNYRDRLVYQGNITASNVTFTLSNIQTSDAGTYTCGAGGGADVIQNCGQKLVVLGKPTTPGRPPVSTTTVYNQSVTLTCSSTSTSVPPDHGLTLNYTWMRDNTDITVTSLGSPYTFTVSSRDSHSYRCRARESQGLESEWSQVYNMEPQYGPYQVSLTPYTSSYTVTEHQALPSITCSARCRPGCSYRWLHNGTVFSSGAVLQGQADRSKTGSYRCQPYNTHGSSDSVTVSVDVQCPPQTPTQFRDLDNTTTSSVWLSWLPGFNGGRPQTFLIEYRQFATRTWAVYKSYDDRDEMMVVEVTGLTPGEVYTFRLQARNDYGNSRRFVFVETTTEGDPSAQQKVDAACTYTGVIAGATVGTFLLTLLVGGIVLMVLYRKGYRIGNTLKGPDHGNS